MLFVSGTQCLTLNSAKNIDESKIAKQEPKVDLLPSDNIALDIAINAGATVKHEGLQAFYHPSVDAITMPHHGHFEDMNALPARPCFMSLRTGLVTNTD